MRRWHPKVNVPGLIAAVFAVNGFLNLVTGLGDPPAGQQDFLEERDVQRRGQGAQVPADGFAGSQCRALTPAGDTVLAAAPT